MDCILVNDRTYIREFISFGGKCPYKCKHCYTFIPEYKYDAEASVDSLVQPLTTIPHIDIVYVSGHKECFVNPDEGISLCEKIYSTASCDILFTTRSCFSPSHIDRLSKLNEMMRRSGHILFGCISIPALYSYEKIERPSLVPSPEKRMGTLKALYEKGIITLLTVRPLFHNCFIPITEPLEIVDRCSSFSNAVLSSGLVKSSYISSALNYPANQKIKDKREIMKCLNQQDVIIEYCDVSEELSTLERFCSEKAIPLFCEKTKSGAESISLEAVDYLKRNMQILNQICN